MEQSPQTEKQLFREMMSMLQETIAISRGLLTVDDIFNQIQSNIPTKQFQAVETLRMTLSYGKNITIDDVINKGLVPELIKFLDDFEKYVL